MFWRSKSNGIANSTEFEEDIIQTSIHFRMWKNALYGNNWRIGQTKKEKMIKNLNRKWKWWCVMRWYDNINSIAYWYQWDEEESDGVFRISEIEEESGGVFRTSEIHILTRGLVYSWKKNGYFVSAHGHKSRNLLVAKIFKIGYLQFWNYLYTI